jgi:hypothetical protein
MRFELFVLKFLLKTGKECFNHSFENRFHYMHTKIHKDWFSHSKVDEKGVINRHTDSMEIGRSHKPTFIFSK